MNLQENFKPFFNTFSIRNKFYKSLKNTKRFLDLGCGYGSNCIALRKIFPYHEIYGVDLIDEHDIPDFIDYKKINLDTDNIPFPDEFFDTILFTHVIEHLNYPLRLGSEINRLLKHGGKIFIEAPNWTTMFIPSFGYKREQHKPFNFFDDPTHLRPWSKHSLFEFLNQTCQLHVEKVGTVRNWARIRLDLFIIIFGLITGNRGYIVSSVWNLSGWCIYGIGIKD